MQTQNVSEERRQSETMEAGSQGRKEGEGAANPPKVTAPVEATQTTGAQLQINGNISHSQIRQSTSHVPQVPQVFRVSAKEPQGTHRSSTTSAGSSQRKRSRVGEEGAQGPVFSMTKIQDFTNAMNGHIDNLHKAGNRGNTGLIRIQMTECMRDIMAEITNVLAKTINTQDLQIGYLKAEKQLKDKIICLQEENNNIKQQVVELQMKQIQKEQEEKSSGSISYAQAVSKNVINEIIAGRQPPLPQISQSVKHAPSECIILFKAEVKGEMKTKVEQEKFRKEVREALNTEEQQTISAIRPTRFGGHTVIFYNEKSRDQAYEKLRKKEEESGVYEEDSKMVAPMKRVAKIVCRDVPSDLSMEQIKKDMYEKHNPALQAINHGQRMGRMYRTRLGLIFELTSAEMVAIQTQGWKIRCDLGRELKVEEFISLQQCYACAKFGHSAIECKATEEVCRLCGKTGHAGKDCEDKNNKEAWKCVNCLRMNASKNLNLDTRHAAAQLHKCPVAQQQKNIRKMQLASTGVYTTPIQKSGELLTGRPNEMRMRQPTNGAQEQGRQTETRRKVRSRSRMRNRNNMSLNVQQRMTEEIRREGKTETSGNTENPCVQRIMKTTLQQSTDGWQVVGRKKKGVSESSERGRRSMRQVEESRDGQLAMDDEDTMQDMDEAHDYDDDE